MEVPEAIPCLRQHQTPQAEEMRLSVDLSQSTKVCVWKADLTNFKVDAVVNAANVNLQHNGGLAHALCQAGGPQINEECKKLISLSGPLKTGDAVVTNAGNLPCKKVIHAVGPSLPPKPTEAMVSSAEKKLARAVWSILNAVEQHNFRSVAIPALSSGILNFPLKRCCYTIVSTLKKFVDQRSSASSPLTINLVNNDRRTVRAMQQACSDIFHESPSTSSLRASDTEQQVYLCLTAQ